MPDTSKGMLFNMILKFIQQKGKPELIHKISAQLDKPLKYIDFFDYPVQELMLITEKAAKGVFPDKKIETALYTLARETFTILAQTPILKAMLPRAKRNPMSVAQKIPFLYRQINCFGNISVVDVKEKSCRIIFKNYKSFPHLQQGFLQQACDYLGFITEVSLDIIKFKNNGNGDILTDFDLSLKLS
ncbi:MAG: DUF2378 family protein [Candidatus Omnitrophota bacterium]